MSDRNNKHGKREADSQASPLTRYKTWLSGLSRGQRIRYRALQVLTVIAILIIVGFLILRSWIKVPELPDFTVDSQTNMGDISGDDFSFEGAEIPDIVLSGRKEGVYTFLLAGRDVASGSTDTILLITYDTNEKKIYGLNLPRDTMINTSSSAKRINAVYARNRGSSSLSEEERAAKGMEALKKEVANLTGITPDFYVLVEWEAIGELVEALGGVEFDVPVDMDYDDPYQDLHIHQEAGLRVLTGDDAMQVIRWRKNNTGSSGGDLARLAIQQDFLKAVAKKCLQPSTFLKIPELARIFTESVSTDLTVGNILAFAQLAYGMDPDTGVSFSTAPLADSFMYKSAALITLSVNGILEIVNDGMNPYQRDIQASDLKVVVRNSNGSFYVTNGTLADSAMGQIPVTTTAPTDDGEEPVETEEPIAAEEPDDENSSQTEPEDPGQTGDGDTSENGDASQPLNEDPADAEEPPQEGEEGQGEESDPPANDLVTRDDSLNEILDPDQVLPDPNANETQVIGAAAEGSGDLVTVRPSGPESLAQAA